MKNKVLNAIIATAMTMSVVLAGCGKKGNGSLNVNKTPTGDNSIKVERPIETPTAPIIEDAVRPGKEYAFSRSISFLSSDLGASLLSDEGVSVTLTATVLPEDAADKSVDWYVQWADDATLKNNPVTDYVTVEPTSDGSTTATVTCRKAFATDSIYIKVVTRDGGFEDRCEVSFVGIPTSMTITTSLPKKTETEGTMPWEYYEIGSDETVEMTVKLNNAFGYVSDIYYEKLTCTPGGPIIRVADEVYTTDGNGETTCEKQNETTISATSIASSVLSVSYADKTLTFTGVKPLENYYERHAYGARGYTYFKKFQGYTSAGEFRGIAVQLYIGEGLGLYARVNVKVVTGVSGVTLSSTGLLF